MRKNLGLSADKCFFYFILIYPIINVASSWFFSRCQTNICRIVFFIIALYANYHWLRTKNLYGFFIDAMIAFICVYIGNLVLIMHTDNIDYFNLLIYLTLWSDKDLSERFSQFTDGKDYIMIAGILFTFLSLIASLVSGVGFIEAQRTKILIGFFNIEHGLAYHVLILYAMTFMIRKKKYRMFVLVSKLLLVVILLLTGVRSAAMALIMLMLFDYKEQSGLTKLMLAIVGFFVLIGLLENIEEIKKIPIIEKTINAANVGDITNGRDNLKQIGIDYYFNRTSTFQKMFGITMNKLRNVYNLAVGARLHAHNDMVNILLGYGAVNLIIACAALVKFAAGPLRLLITLIMVILAYTNGLFMYFPFVVMLPILKIGLNTAYNKSFDNR